MTNEKTDREIAAWLRANARAVYRSTDPGQL